MPLQNHPFITGGYTNPTVGTLVRAWDETILELTVSPYHPLPGAEVTVRTLTISKTNCLILALE